MLKFNLQRISFTGNIKVECNLSYENIEPIVEIQYFDHKFGSLKFSGDDLFSALENVRVYLEEKKFLLLCAGSMPNTYPSRMSRQMSNGRKAYKHTYGKTPDKSDIIDIFQPARFEEVGTIDDQKKIISKWHQYFDNMK